MKEHMNTIWNVSTVSIGAFGGVLFGGWSHLLGFLLLAASVDYLSGMMAATVEGGLKSKVGFIGIFKKVMMFFVVIMAAQLDIAVQQSGVNLELLGLNASIRDAAVVFYLSNEVLSIVENAGRIGVKLPAPVINAVEILKKRTDQNKRDDEQ